MSQFTLRMTFDGLCLFAPDFANPQGARLHALLVRVPHPASAHGSAHHPEHAGAGSAARTEHGAGHTEEHEMPPHLPMLYVDSSYLAAEPRREESGHLFGWPLDRRTITVSGVGKPIETNPGFGDRILDIGTVSNTGLLDPTLVQDPLPAQVAARVTFTVGVPGSDSTTAFWRVHPSNNQAPFETQLSDWTEWRVPGIATNQLVLTLTHADGGAPVNLHLRPVARQIRVHVYCSPKEDLPGGVRRPPPEIGDPAEHFPGFYALFPQVPPAHLTLARARTTETTRCVTARLRVGP